MEDEYMCIQAPPVLIEGYDLVEFIVVVRASKLSPSSAHPESPSSLALLPPEGFRKLAYPSRYNTGS